MLLEPTPEVWLPAEGGGPFTEFLPVLTVEDGDSDVEIASNLEVSTEGALGADGFATSSSSVENVGGDVEESFLVADLVDVECRSDMVDGPTGSATVIGGAAVDILAEEAFDIPESPEPNTVVVDREVEEDSQGDILSYQLLVVANEQIVNGDDIEVTGIRYEFHGELVDGSSGAVLAEQTIEWVVGVATCGIDVETSVTHTDDFDLDLDDDISTPDDLVVAEATPRFTG